MNKETLFNAMIDLCRYRNEYKDKYLKGPNGQIQVYKYPTDRAVLAKRKILLKETIGQGSYSKVKCAFDLERFQKVAVKIIDRSKAPLDFQQKFLPRELDVWIRLAHKNIVRMTDNFEIGNKTYMILEFADGGDMLNHVQKLSGPVSESMCRLWFSQICDAIKYLHDRNIIHRDLKLENILLDSSNNIKICDFGFAKELNTEESLSQTYCGSRAYASPEILMGSPYDPKKADIWAIGVIFYIFLTGSMPFQEDINNDKILTQQRNLKLFSQKEASIKISNAAKKFVKWMFTFDWTERPSIVDIVNNQNALRENALKEILHTTNTEYNLRYRKIPKTMDFANINRKTKMTKFQE